MIEHNKSGYIDALALSVNVASPDYLMDDIYGDTTETTFEKTDSTGRQTEGQKDDNISKDKNRIQHRRLDENPSACGHFMNHSPKPNTTLYPFAWSEVYPNYHAGADDTMYDLPNVARTDGAPRYIFYQGSEMIFYDVDESQFKVKDVCGAIICANTDIDVGQEVFRDYGLEAPYPPWADNWYVPSHDENSPTKYKPNDDNDDDDDGEEWRLT
jgi:hypothetical protein